MQEQVPELIEIKDFSAPELDLFVRTPETQLFHYYEPEPGLFLAETPMVIERALDAGYRPLSFLVEKQHLNSNLERILRNYREIPVYTAAHPVLAQMTGYQLTRGMICAMHRKKLPDMEKMLAGKRRIAVLENVMNPTNVGAIIRSAAALHIEAVLLTKGCSDPLYRRASRVSMGTVFQIPWTFTGVKMSEWPENGIRTLKRMGFRIVAMALSGNMTDLSDRRIQEEERLAIILGSEGYGLLPETISESDYCVRIPMAEGVDSLNVAAASAVAFWQLGIHT